jgi:hypothetical protein
MGPNAYPATLFTTADAAVVREVLASMAADVVMEDSSEEDVEEEVKETQKQEDTATPDDSPEMVGAK